MESKSLIDKLRKLIAMEKSARSIGNQAEAEAFADRIQTILTEHKLSMSEVEFEHREATEPIDWETVNLKAEGFSNSKANLMWRVRIARAIATANSCAIVNQDGSRGTTFYFVGRTSDREMAKVLYLYLIELGEDLSAKSTRESQSEQREKFMSHKGYLEVPSWERAALGAWMKEYRNSWKMGFGEVVSKRIIQRYEDLIKNPEATGAIVHIKKDALAVQDYLKGKIHQNKSKIRGSLGNSDGYNNGKNTGSAVNISPNRFSNTSGRTARLLTA